MLPWRPCVGWKRHNVIAPEHHQMFLSVPFSCNFNKWKLTFSSPVATAEFSKFAGILSAALSQHHLELDCEDSWAPKNWCFWTVVLEKTLESPLDCKEIQPVHPKGDQSWVFIGRTDAEAETPILWPPDAKSWLIWKDPDAGRNWGQEKWTTEDEMVGWHHWLNGSGFG